MSMMLFTNNYNTNELFRFFSPPSINVINLWSDETLVLQSNGITINKISVKHYRYVHLYYVKLHCIMSGDLVYLIYLQSPIDSFCEP